MKFINFGGATAIIEHNGKRIFFDPWLDDGIFHGAWFHFPPAVLGIEDIGHVDYVYISHIHEDHCSAGTIKHINSDAEIILMDRRPNLVKNFLSNNNLHFKKIHLISPRTPVELEPGLIVDMVEPNPDDEMTKLIDSSIVINWDGFTLYNANDCQPHSDGIQYIKNNYKRVDLALLPYSGGSGYPSCYTNLTDAEKLSEKERIIKSRVKSFIDSVRQLNPVYVIPFADAWCVGGSRSDLNKFVAHSSCRGIVERPFKDSNLQSNLLLINTGQDYNFDTNKKTPDEPYTYYTENDRDDYIASKLTDVSYDYEKFTFEPAVSLPRQLKYARSRQWDAQKRLNYFPEFSFYFDTIDTDQRFHISTLTEDVNISSTDTDLVKPYLRISVPRNLLIMLLIGHISWNIADAAFFLEYDRVPNTYDPEIYALLNYLRA